MSARDALRAIYRVLEARGWQDAGDTAVTLADYLDRGGTISAAKLRPLIAPEFLARNGVSRSTAAETFAALEYSRTAAAVAGRPLLLLSADPVDQPALRVQAEQRMIRDEIERSPARSRVHIETRPGLLRTDLARYVLETRPSVVHFSGHGNSDAICVEDVRGASSRISTKALGHLFSMPAVVGTVQLVVLASCLSEPQARAIADSVPAVVGMRSTIPDEAALAFSRGFYMALAQGLSVAEAFEFGRNSVVIEELAEEDAPILLSRRTATIKTLRPFVR